jgi:hypothetical protein
VTSEQDVNLRSCEVDDHPSVLVPNLTFVGDLVLSNLGVPYIQTLIEKSRQCPCRQFNFDPYGDHIQTCPCQSATFPAHEWRVYKLSLLLISVGHKVKTQRMTPVTDNERVDVTTTHDRYGRTSQITNGALTHRVSSSGAPQPDGVLNNAVRIKIRYYRHLYTDRSDPIVFLSVTVTTSGHVYDDFVRVFFKSLACAP